MAGLSTRDYQRMLDLMVSATERLGPGRPPWQLVCEGMMDVLAGTIVGIMDVRLPAGVLAGRTWPAWTQEVVLNQPCLVRAHPLVRHYAAGIDRLPRTVSDVTDSAQWCRSTVYDRANTDLAGACQQLAVPLEVTTRVQRTLTVGRPDTDFSERDRTIARRLQPFLVALDRQGRVVDTWNRRIGPDAAGRLAHLDLTQRETAVLALVADGLTATAIARRLGVTPYTVSKHQQNIYRKLGTHDRLQTVLLAREFGLLPVSPPVSTAESAGS